MSIGQNQYQLINKHLLRLLPYETCHFCPWAKPRSYK